MVVYGIPIAALVTFLRLWGDYYLVFMIGFSAGLSEVERVIVNSVLIPLFFLLNLPLINTLIFLFTGLPFLLLGKFDFGFAFDLSQILDFIAVLQLIFLDLPLYGPIAAIAYGASVLFDGVSQDVQKSQNLKVQSNLVDESIAEVADMQWWKILLMFFGIPLIQLGTFIVEEIYFISVGNFIGW